MKHALILLSLLASTASQAQTRPVDVVVQQVNDRRTGSGSFSELMISLQLPKVLSSQVAASRVLVTSAVDDTDASLVDAEKGEPGLEANGGGMLSQEEPQTPVSVSLTLKNPSRKATKLKEVRGEVELFMPAKDPNSVAEVSKFLSFSGKTINHKALKSNGVEIVLLSKSQIEAERKKIADAKRKEYKEAGYPDGEELENTVKGMMEYTLQVEPNDVPVRIKDPKKSIQELEYVDSKGEVKRVYTRDLHEDIGAITTWGDPPAADWKLRVKMKTTKNMVRHAFVLKDVALP